MTPKYYIVGGYVRDLLLGTPSKDVDFAVEASSYDAMKTHLLSFGVTIFQEKPEFLAIRGSHPIHGGVDYVLCRKESFYSDGRHPDNVSIGTIYDDLARRDFTVNAIALDGDKVIDPFGGKNDLDARLLRCVGNTQERFAEDYLRILRAMRFSITKNFRLDVEIVKAFHSEELLQGLIKVSRERVFEELRRCFDFDTLQTIQFIDDRPILKDILFKQIGIKLSPRL